MQLKYEPVPGSTFSKRHLLTIFWSKASDHAIAIPIQSLKVTNDLFTLKLEMASVACPDNVQSEAYISTVALFLLFASTSEQKVYMRLPAVWRDLWEELSSINKEHVDAERRSVLRELQRMIEESEHDKSQVVSESAIPEKTAIPDQQSLETRTSIPLQQSSPLSSEELKNVWRTKEQASSYQRMLTTRKKLPIHSFKRDLLLTIADHQVVILCGETGCGKSTQGTLSR